MHFMKLSEYIKLLTFLHDFSHIDKKKHQERKSLVGRCYWITRISTLETNLESCCRWSHVPFADAPIYRWFINGLSKIAPKQSETSSCLGILGDFLPLNSTIWVCTGNVQMIASNFMPQSTSINWGAGRWWKTTVLFGDPWRFIAVAFHHIPSIATWEAKNFTSIPCFVKWPCLDFCSF